MKDSNSNVTGHTPGPRFVIDRGDGTYEVGYGAPNAESGALISGDRAKADALLDAAGPDLLEACEAFASAFDENDPQTVQAECGAQVALALIAARECVEAFKPLVNGAVSLLIATANNPLTIEQCAAVASMALYWREVRQRQDTSPLTQEASTVYQMIGGVNGLLRLTEFCAACTLKGEPQR